MKTKNILLLLLMCGFILPLVSYGQTNTFTGIGAGTANAGLNNSGFGNNALYTNTAGTDNTGIGYAALYYTNASSPTASFNTAIGSAAGYNSTGIGNTATGYQALYSGAVPADNTGIYNVANGYQPLFYNTSGSYNIGIGYQSLYGNVVDDDNIGIGYQALFGTQADDNVAIGFQVLYSNAGDDNDGIGYQALFNNQEGSPNDAMGFQALFNNVTGSNNIAMGFQSGLDNNEGDNNVFLGVFAGQSNVTGSNNTAVGFNTDFLDPNLDNSTVIGHGAVVNTNNTVVLGNTDVLQLNFNGALAPQDVALGGDYNPGEPGQVLTSRGADNPPQWATPSGGGSGTVTSIGLTVPGGFSVAGSPVTTSGTIGVTYTGGDGILQGLGGAISPITIGSGLTFSGGTLSATGSGGTVTSVGLTMPSGFTVTGSPVTTSGTFTVGTSLNGIVQASGGGFNTITIGSGLSFSGGTLSATGGGGTVPGGYNADVQYNNGGAFGGDNNYEYITGTGIELQDNFPNENIFIGTPSHPSGTTPTIGNQNVGVGMGVLQNLTSGSDNIAEGINSLRFLQGGNGDIAIGEDALYNSTSSNGSIGIGYEALMTNVTGNGLISIGGGDVSVDGLNSSISLGGSTITESDEFIVNSGIVNWNIGGIPYVLPPAQGSAGQALVIENVLGGVAQLEWGCPTACGGGGDVESVGTTAPIYNTGTSSAPVIAIQGLNSNEGGVLYSTGIGNSAAFSAIGASGQVLQSNGTNAPAWGAVNLATEVTGVLPIANGGTGAATANAALNNLLPSQTGNSGKYLTTNGTSSSWSTVDATITDAQIGYGNISNQLTSDGDFRRTSYGIYLTDDEYNVFFNGGNGTVTGQSNIALSSAGGLSLVEVTSGADNIAIGYSSMSLTSSGSNNVAIGYQSLLGNITGSNLIGIGNNASVIAGDFNNSIALGAYATIGESNQFIVASSIVNWDIGGIPYVVPPAQGSAGTVLTNTDGAGTLAWEPAGGGGVSLPLDQIGYGTGSGIASDPNFTYVSGTGLNVQDNSGDQDIMIGTPASPISGTGGGGIVAIGGGINVFGSATTVAIGQNVNVNNALYNVVIGEGAQITEAAWNNVGIGNDASINASGGFDVAIGNQAVANGNYTTVLGSNANDAGESNSVILGFGATGSGIGNELYVSPSITNANLAGVPYTLPNAQGSTGTVLTNTDGAGTLAWEPVSGGGAPVYPASYVPFGDGVTPGGVTDGDITWNTGYYLGLQNEEGDILIGTPGDPAGTPNGEDFASNIAIGGGAFTSTQTALNSGQNIAIGGNALAQNTRGSNNIAIGYGCFGGVQQTGGGLIGIGSGVDVSTDGYSNSVALGDYTSITSSNQFIVNPSITNWNVGGVAYVVPNAQATEGGQALINDGSGNLYWGCPTACGDEGDILPSSKIPFGDGITPGGITSDDFFLNTDPSTAQFHVSVTSSNTSSLDLNGVTGETQIVADAIDLKSSHVNINNVNYNWSQTQGAPNSVLTNDGSGNLTWQPLNVNQLIKQNNASDSIITLQQQQLATQQSEIDQLSTMVSKLDVALSECCTSYQSTTTGSAVQPGTTNSAPYLNQNFPNPFSQNTTISCYVPNTAQNASIVIYDLNGQKLNSFTIPATGFNQVVVAGGTLAAGDYLYTLYVDGQKVDTKKMTLTH